MRYTHPAFALHLQMTAIELVIYLDRKLALRRSRVTRGQRSRDERCVAHMNMRRPRILDQQIACVVRSLIQRQRAGVWDLILRRSKPRRHSCDVREVDRENVDHLSPSDAERAGVVRRQPVWCRPRRENVLEQALRGSTTRRHYMAWPPSSS